jgi:hypothetical protein
MKNGCFVLETSDLSVYSTAELDYLCVCVDQIAGAVSRVHDYCDYDEDDFEPLVEFVEEVEDEVGRLGDVLRGIWERVVAELARRRQLVEQPTAVDECTDQEPDALVKKDGPMNAPSCDVQQDTEGSMLLVKNTVCKHEYYICESVAEYQELVHSIPCPVCQPEFRYRDHGIYLMQGSSLMDSFPAGFLSMLVCGDCHDELCPHCQGHT